MISIVVSIYSYIYYGRARLVNPIIGKNMQKFNAVTLVPNMPVKYITIDQQDNLAEDGHFAFYDEAGYPYVFEGGGTSYTRGLSQTIKCKHVMVMTTRDQGVYNSEALIEATIGGKNIVIGDRDQHEFSYSMLRKKK